MCFTFWQTVRTLPTPGVLGCVVWLHAFFFNHTSHKVRRCPTTRITRWLIYLQITHLSPHARVGAPKHVNTWREEVVLDISGIPVWIHLSMTRYICLLFTSRTRRGQKNLVQPCFDSVWHEWLILPPGASVCWIQCQFIEFQAAG